MYKTRSFSSSANEGFTLLEIMIVIAIIGAVLAMGAPRLFNSGTAMRTSIRKMAVMTREIRNASRLTGSTMRLAMNLDEKKGEQFWVESASGQVTLLTGEQQKKLDDDMHGKKDDEKPKSEFATDTRVLKKPETLPKGLFFESVELASHDQPITEGMAYVHFFPQGLAEEAAIHLTNKKTLNWTITINPLTGRAEVYERKLTLKELRDAK